MIAYRCKLCGKLVIPGVSIDDLADHLLWDHPEKFPEFAGQEGLICSIDCLDYFQQLDGVKVFKIWDPKLLYRVFLVFARSEAEALERYRRGNYEFYHSPIHEYLWSRCWKELSGIIVWLAEKLTQEYEEVQAYERGYLETSRGTCCEGHAGVPGI